MSSFKSIPLFDSGPHRFTDPAEGQQIVPRVAIGQAIAGSLSLGDQEIIILVRGRLIADTEAQLDTIVTAIRTELANFAVAGTLVDDRGHSWPNMKFARFEPADRRDRGRRISLAYTARFYRI